MLTFDVSGCGEILPIFSSKEEALNFLEGMVGYPTPPHLGAIFTGRGRLASLLCGELGGIDRIAFDPLPEPDLSKTVVLASMRRGSFVDSLLGRGRTWCDQGGRGVASRVR